MIHNSISHFGMLSLGGKERYDHTLEETVSREVKEETDLDVEKTKYLNWIFQYKSLGVNCKEYVYISLVNDGEIVLNEESIDYKWCGLDEFIDLIEWYGSKNELRNVLEYALKGELYYTKVKIEKS